MGRVFGIIAKNKEELITKRIIYTPHPDKGFYLTELLPPSVGYSIPILNGTNFSDLNKQWFELKPDEITALTYNDVFGSAAETIRYTKSMNESFSPYFKAIKLEYDLDSNELIYSNEYSDFENWTETKVMKKALYKMTIILFEHLKQNIASGGEDIIRTAFDNFSYMHNSIDVLSKIMKLEKVAIISNEE